MLNWTAIETYEATTPDGRVYRVCRNPHKGLLYMAICSRMDACNRLWEHVVGFCDTVEQAKAMCELDAKE